MINAGVAFSCLQSLFIELSKNNLKAYNMLHQSLDQLKSIMHDTGTGTYAKIKRMTNISRT